jgi:predicted alpha/beta-fold hydrolase
VTTRDGDFVDLDWTEPAPRDSTTSPILLVLHGLEGSTRSHYVGGLLQGAQRHGWRGVALNFRSCSGEMNRRARFYHSGDTGDLDEVVALIAARHPGVPIGAIGVSLGGNVLLKWLGETAEKAPLRAAAAISVPFDLAACAAELDRGLPRLLYTSNFMRTLRAKVRAKAREHPGFVDVAAALRARTFAEYDEIVTAPLGGFAGARDYWARSSSGPYLARIRRPTLVINARDDPFVPHAALPDPAALPPSVRVDFPARGGHAAFIDGRWPWRAGSWAERRALEFIAAELAAVP